MGIKSNINKFLKNHCADVFETIHLSEYSFKKVAIDISLYMYKFKAVCGDRWLTAFLNLVASMRRNEIHSVFIYDGGAPPEKEGERAERKMNRDKLEKRIYDLTEAWEKYEITGEIDMILSDLHCKKKSPVRLLGKSSSGIDMKKSPVRLLGKSSSGIDMKKSPVRLLGKSSSGIDMNWVKEKIEKVKGQLVDISPADFELTKDLFRILQVPFFVAPMEAETMCSDLCKRGLVDGALSEDTDVMAYRSPVFLSKINTTADTCVRIRHDAILEGLELEGDQFLDLCIMCGTDYNKNIKGIGAEKAYIQIQQHGSIEAIGANTKLDISVLNHLRGRELFNDYERHSLTKVPFCGSPDFDKLAVFMGKHNINLSIDRLKNDFVHNMVIFGDSDDEKEYEEVVGGEVGDEDIHPLRNSMCEQHNLISLSHILKMEKCGGFCFSREPCEIMTKAVKICESCEEDCNPTNTVPYYFDGGLWVNSSEDDEIVYREEVMEYVRQQKV
jgi:5'-3' exonuclease